MLCFLYFKQYFVFFFFSAWWMTIGKANCGRFGCSFLCWLFSRDLGSSERLDVEKSLLNKKRDSVNKFLRAKFRSMKVVESDQLFFSNDYSIRCFFRVTRFLFFPLHSWTFGLEKNVFSDLKFETFRNLREFFVLCSWMEKKRLTIFSLLDITTPCRELFVVHLNFFWNLWMFKIFSSSSFFVRKTSEESARVHLWGYFSHKFI